MTSLTGHISKFRKNVLMKGSEKGGESSDSKREEVEATQETLTKEERLKTLYSDLEQKYETSWLQIKQQTAAH